MSVCAHFLPLAPAVDHPALFPPPADELRPETDLTKLDLSSMYWAPGGQEGKRGIVMAVVEKGECVQVHGAQRKNLSTQ